MKENEDKNIEQYVQAAIKKAPLESPSPDFTAKVMKGIFAFDKSTATVYKPLISKKGWFLIFGGIIATLVYFLINDQAVAMDQPWWLGSGVKEFSKAFTNSHLFQFSRTTMNVILLTAMLIIIQITLLKNYLDKRLAK